MLRLAVTAAALAGLAVGAAACGGGGDGNAGGEVVTFERSPTAPKSAPPPRIARARLFTIRPPAGWTREDSTLTGGIERSEWRDPGAAGTSALVDAIASATSEPEERARRNRDRGAAKPGYREHAFEPVALGGRDGYLWDYERSGRRVVDYFLNDCGDGFAVQGAAPAATFAEVQRTFREVAVSLHSTHC
jgi:hypothetical protein